MARQIISARQLQKLAKNDAPVFLAIVRANEPPTNERKGKRSQNREAKFAAAHGITEGQKRHINKQKRAQRKILYLLKESTVLDSVPEKHTGKTWKHSLRSTGTSFLKNCQRVYPHQGRYNMLLRLNQAVNLPIDHHIGWTCRAG